MQAWYFGMHLQICKHANSDYVHEQKGRYESNVCVYEDRSADRHHHCMQNQLCRAAMHAACTESGWSRKGCVQEVAGKGNMRERRKSQRGRRETENVGEDVQSVAWARRWREGKERNKRNICHTEDTFDEKQA